MFAVAIDQNPALLCEDATMEDNSFDPRARAEEKRRSREEDRLALAHGEKSTEDLRRENGLFAFSHVRIDLDGAESLA